MEQVGGGNEDRHTLGAKDFTTTASVTFSPTFTCPPPLLPPLPFTPTTVTFTKSNSGDHVKIF